MKAFNFYKRRIISLKAENRWSKQNSYAMNRMIAANLIYRPIRSLISIVAVALEASLLILCCRSWALSASDCCERFAHLD